VTIGAQRRSPTRAHHALPRRAPPRTIQTKGQLQPVLLHAQTRPRQHIMTRQPLRETENIRPTWVPAGRNKKAWEPIAVYEQDYPRKAPRPVASGISFREGDLGDAKVVDLIKVCDFYEAKASGKYTTPVACGRYVHDLAREVRAVACSLNEGKSQHAGRLLELEKICKEWDQYFGPSSDAAGRLSEDGQQGFLGLTPLTPAALHEERIWMKQQLEQAQKAIRDAERGGDTRAQKAEKALADFQRLSRDAASRARAAHDLELQAQARELDAAYASRSAQAASDTVHVDPESGAAFTLGSRQRKAARVSSGGGGGAVPRVSSSGPARVSSGGARPATGGNVARSTPSFAPASPRPKTPVERVQEQARQQQLQANRNIRETKQEVMRAKDDTARVTAELNDVKRQLEACQARARAMSGAVEDADSYSDMKVRDALKAYQAAQRAKMKDADCQTGPCGSLRFAHAPRGPRAITSRQVLVRECPCEVAEDRVVRQISSETGVALLQSERRPDLDGFNTYALEVLCATPEDACKLVEKDGTVVACNPNPQVIPEPRAPKPLALAPTPIEVVNLDLSPYAIPEVARSRSRSPIREDPFADFEDVLGRLSKVRPASISRRPFRS
jgi:hypothetical protein